MNKMTINAMNFVKEQQDLVCDADIFIIPNQIGYLKNQCLPQYFAEDIEKFNMNNGTSYPVSSTGLVQVWVTNEYGENFSCHSYMNPDDEYHYLHFRGLNYIPLELLADLNEGDTVSFTATATAKNDAGEELPARVKINATARQLDYRYRNHGSFENCLAKLKGAI